MIVRGITLMAMLVLTSLARAEGFWVLGSFEREPAARSAALEAAPRIDERILVARSRVDGKTTYRVIVGQSGQALQQKAALRELGYAPWNLEAKESSLDIVLSTDDLPEPRLFLVLAAFSSEQRAMAFARELGANLRMSEDGDVARVVRGPFSVRDEAVMQAAKADGFEGAWWLDATGTGEREPAAASRGQRSSKESVVSADADAAERAPSEKPPTSAASESQATMRAPRQGESSARRVGASQSVSDRQATRDTDPEPVRADEEKTSSQTMAASEEQLASTQAEIVPPRPGQSYLDYCVREANLDERLLFCSGDRFVRNAAREYRTGESPSGELLLEFCARDATQAQRREFCTGVDF